MMNFLVPVGKFVFRSLIYGVIRELGREHLDKNSDFDIFNDDKVREKLKVKKRRGYPSTARRGGRNG